MKTVRRFAPLLAALALVLAVPSGAQNTSTTYGLDTNGNLAQRMMITGDACVVAGSVGTVSGTGVAVSEACALANTYHLSTFTLTAVSIATTDATTNGSHGALKIYTFPLGKIQIDGCKLNVTTTAGSGGITDTAALVGGLGTVTNDTSNATLTSTEQDLVGSIAGTLAGGLGLLQGSGSLIATGFDGTSTAEDVWINISVPDAGSTSSDTVTLTGSATCLWHNTGDPTP